MTSQTERAVLACIITDPDCILDARDNGVTPAHFRDPQHAAVYRTMLDLADRRIPPDVVNLPDHDVAASLVADIMAEPVTPTWFYSYRDALIRDYRTHVGRDALRHAAEAIGQEGADPAAILLDAVTHLDDRSTGPQPFSVYADQIEQRLAQQEAGTYVEDVTTTGFPTFDRAMAGGFRPGELVVLAARPAMGKSALALTLARHAARKGGALIFSLEMSGLSIYERAVADAAGVGMDTLRAKRLDPDLLARLRRTNALMRQAEVYVDDTAGLTTAQAGARVARHLAEHACSLVVVDYLQIMGDERQRNTSGADHIAKISGFSKRLAMQHHVPVLLLSQLNRNVEHRDPPIPVLSDLRDSGAIEQDADSVLMLYRHDYYAGKQMTEEDRSKTGTCDVFIRKQRNGAEGMVTLGFDARSMSFSDPTLAPPTWMQEGAAD